MPSRHAPRCVKITLSVRVRQEYAYRIRISFRAVSENGFDMGVPPYQLSSGVRLSLLFIAVLSMGYEIFAYADPGLEKALESGTWGGRGAALQVLESGAFIEFDCAIGRIGKPITVQPNGQFSAPGQYYRETGGPVRLSDKEPTGSPAVFSGEVTGSELLLRIALPEEGRTIGPFILTKSLQAELEKCL